MARYSIKKGNASEINTLHFFFSSKEIYIHHQYIFISLCSLHRCLLFQNPGYYHSRTVAPFLNTKDSAKNLHEHEL